MTNPDFKANDRQSPSEKRSLSAEQPGGRFPSVSHEKRANPAGEATRPLRPGDNAQGGRLLVAICTFNERENLPELSDRIIAALPHADLLVVDDNSPDGTGQWALAQAVKDERFKVIIREEERGLGGAIRRALQFAVDQNYELLINLDGDLSHEPEVLPSMVSLITGDPAIDVVVGSRYCPGGSVRGWPLRRKVMSRLVNRFATSILRLPVSDCSGSLRCYRVSVIRKIAPETLQSEGYAILEEILLRLRAVRAKMVEIPIVFNDRTRGQSKLTAGETLRSARQLIRMALAK
jgi:dolichol-phosphate mannosyltransferase